jgi:hypothetical protein
MTLAITRLLTPLARRNLIMVKPGGNTFRCAAGWAAALITWILLSPCIAEVKEPDRTVDLLTLETASFTNVTVTHASTSHVFIKHQGGLTSLKISELPLDIQERLGYPVPKPKTNTVAKWTRSQVSKIRSQDLERVKHDLEARVPGARLPRLEKLSPAALATVAAVLLILHLFFSFCCALICRKAGLEPGFLIWMPLFQLLPLVRAANMSPWWVLAWLVPLLNIVAQVLWAFKIAKARQKSVWTAVLLLLPPTSLLAFLYLAFSAGAAKEKPSPGPQLMTLEAI